MPRSTSSSPHMARRPAAAGGPKENGAVTAVGSARARPEPDPTSHAAQLPAAGAVHRVTSLAIDLLRSRAPADATRTSVRLLFEATGSPVAAWMVSREGPPQLIGVRGLGAPRRRRLAAVGLPRPDDESPARTIAQLERRFRTVSGGFAVSTTIVGDVALLVGDDATSTRRLLDDVASLLTCTIDRMSEVRLAEERNRSLERGIAWTAHELRSPLLGVRAALDSVLQVGGRAGEPRELLRRSRDEVAELADATESILRFAVDAEGLHRRKVDLSLVVRDAASSMGLDAPSVRIRLSAEPGVMVRVDARQLRRAIENLFRNALAYSPRDTEVVVTVSNRGGVPTVSVSDRGPGVTETERDAIFDPFVRGASNVRGGRGLGLFIARRIAEAHGGRIAVSSDHAGATFRLELPARAARSVT